jgi:hypothetical protein
VLVALVGAGVAYGAGRLRPGPDAGRVVYATDTGVFVRELATGAQRRVLTLPSGTLGVWPSPDGRWLAYLRRSGELWLAGVDDGRRWRVSERSAAVFGWSPDIRLVALELQGQGRLVAVDPGGRGSRVLASGYRGGAPVWLDAGTFAAALGRDTILVRTRGDRTSARRLLEDAWPLAAAPGGGELLVLRGPERRRSRVVVADVDGERVAGTRAVFEGKASRAAVSRQGFVAFSGRDRSDAAGVWVLESGESVRRVARAEAGALAWSVDGSSVLYEVDGVLYARDVREERTVRLGSRVRGFAVV